MPRESANAKCLIYEFALISPDGGVQPDGAGPSCLGGLGMREEGINLSTNAYSSVDSVKLVDFSVSYLGAVCFQEKKNQQILNI